LDPGTAEVLVGSLFEDGNSWNSMEMMAMMTRDARRAMMHDA
jgi:hypothetical protein